MRRRTQWIRRIAIVVLALLVSFVVGMGWLLGSASGARFVIKQATQFAPGELNVSDVDGTLLRGLDLRAVRWQQDDFSVSVDAARIVVAPGVLLNVRRLQIRELLLRDVQIVVPERVPQDPAPALTWSLPALPDVASPIRIIVDRFELERAVFSQQRENDAPAQLARVERASFQGEWVDDEIEVQRLDIESEQGSLSLVGNVTLTPLLPIMVSVDWAIDSAAGTLVVSGNRRGYQVDHDLAKPVIADSSGIVVALTDDPVSVDLTTRLPEVTLTIVGEPLGVRQSEVRLTGSAFAWRLNASSGVSVRSSDWYQASAELSGNLGEIMVQDLSLTDPESGQLRVTGTVAAMPSLAWDLNVVLESFVLPAASNVVESAVDGALSTQGNWLGDRRIDLSIAQLAGVINGRSLSASGALTWSSLNWRANDLAVALGPNALRVSGEMSASGALDGTAVVDAQRLSALHEDLSGALVGELTIGGTRQAPLMTGELKVGALAWRDLFSVAEIEANIALDADRLNARLFGQDIVLTGRHIDSVDVRAAGSLAAHTIDASAIMDRRYAVSLAAAGGLDSAQWNGEVTSLNGRIEDYPRETEDLTLALQSPVTVALGADRMSASKACFTIANSRDVCVAGGWQSAGDIALNVQAPRIMLGELVPQELASAAWSGNAAFNMNVSGPIDALNGNGTLTVEQLVAKRTSDVAAQRIAFGQIAGEFTVINGQLDANTSVQLPQTGSLTADVRLQRLWASQSPIAASIDVAVDDLGLVNAFTDAVQVSEGALGLEATVGGSLASPRFTLQSNVESLQARVLPLGIELSQVNGTLNARDTREVSFSGTGISGPGSFDFDGAGSIDAGIGLVIRARVKADQLALIDVPDFSVTSSADINIVASADKIAVEGELGVDKARIVVRDLPAGSVAVSPDITVTYPDEALPAGVAERQRSTELDLAVSLSEDVRLSGFGLSTRLTGDLDVRQRAGRDVQGFGQLALQDATYIAYGQTLDVSRGRLVFSGALEDPALDIRAERTIDETSVGIDIRGTPAQLESTLFSSPSLPESEILSLLLTGQTLSAADQTEGNALADAALLLGVRQAIGVSGAIRDSVGLDTLTLSGTGRDGRLLAGKQLSPNLYLQYAYGVFDQLSTVLVRLKLNDRLSLESTSGADQSIDLIYSVGRP